MPKTPSPGDRIRLVTMSDDPDSVRPGQIGTVIAVYCHEGTPAWQQIDVAWDSGRTLMLVVPPDRFEIVYDQADHR